MTWILLVVAGLLEAFCRKYRRVAVDEAFVGIFAQR
ncbi:hypothetical protein PMI02_00924 [Novosphingobium sp. AP12]|nr:hypothetical protein PMI02_00924 [Novosphingobium sp. AP12]